jgi:hypothetical protein
VPALLLFSAGLSSGVAPLTATVLADADETDAGVNNAIAPIASVAPSRAGITVARAIQVASVRAFHVEIGICAVLVAVGGILALAAIRYPRRPISFQDCADGQPLDAVRRHPDQAVRDAERAHCHWFGHWFGDAR